MTEYARPASPTSTKNLKSGVLRSLPLERKLPLLILALFTAVLAISTAASYYEVRHAAEQAAGERLNGLTQVLGSLVEQQIAGHLAIMRRVGHDTAVLAALRSPSRPLSAAALKALAPLAATPTDASAPGELWTADGQPLGKPRVELEVPSDASRLRVDVRRMATSGDSGFVSPLRAVNGRAVFVVAAPVREPGGATLGYVVQERHFNNNPRALQPFRDLIGGSIDLFFRNVGDGTWTLLNGTVVAPPTQTRPAPDSLSVFTNAGDRSVLGASRRVRGTPLLVTVERPLDDILAGPRAMMRILLFIGILLAILGAASAWGISHRLVRPLSELTAAAEGLATGEYDRRVHVQAGDEIGRLGTAFNRMAEEVEASSDASARSLDRLTEAMQSQAFLAEASRILASSLSDDSLLARLARFCVPAIADFCSIHVTDDAGQVRRIESVHVDPSTQAKLRSFIGRSEYSVDEPLEVAKVIRSQSPLLLESIDLPSLLSRTSDRERRQLLETVHPTSFLCVPLVARGQSIGALSLAMAGSGRVFKPEDVDNASELGRRAAVAMDNAVIYRRSLLLRQEAEAASSAKSDFLAKMSHEIRTPINAMMGYAELLQMGIAGPVNDAQTKQLARIRSSGDHLTNLVSEILDLAKIEAGKMSVDHRVGSASEAAESALGVVRPQAATKGVELQTVTDDDDRTEYVGDANRVHQILTNLLSNAVKFTPAGGVVSIRCAYGARPGFTSASGAAEWTCFAVQDTGVGIAAEDLERIFQPFVQVESVYTRSQGGTGLGLTISRNLAQMMGGEISVDSRLGEGSTFTLWLPCPKRALEPVRI